MVSSGCLDSHCRGVYWQKCVKMSLPMSSVWFSLLLRLLTMFLISFLWFLYFQILLPGSSWRSLCRNLISCSDTTIVCQILFNCMHIFFPISLSILIIMPLNLLTRHFWSQTCYRCAMRSPPDISLAFFSLEPAFQVLRCFLNCLDFLILCVSTYGY